MACERTTFTSQVTRITAAWLNSIDALKVAIGCATTKAQAQAALDIVPRTEYQTQINSLQAQINSLQLQVDTLEQCLAEGNYCIRVVTALPGTPDPNIIYFVTG
jgi:hypothetical protein